MNQELQIALILFGLCVIAGLLYIIRSQLKAQQQRKQAEQERIAEIEAKAQQQRDHLVESVRVISMAMQDEQCELAEGCIRLKMLLDHLAPYLHEHQDFSVINQMYEGTKHMPILDEWKKLKIKQRFEFTKEREALEREYRQPILAAAKKLVSYRFEQ
ncbi:DUF2489 domain-containing protein [Motiliproteus sp. MSK22-1]|uniref:DUF2489 domain-containing protein n=1 Tax=Motiliproteus sp. MSK22-1 TaxID=1897630 RepID=UPI000976EE75|nr:DUF2489 domain-containing protein [Motiliproteus sp. MSK22-1]OMH39139.1 hypothetical protein BGP75_05425 [Motiliproteus sp. MSK22-1]